MWKEACLACSSPFTRSPHSTPKARLTHQQQTPHACVSSVADGSQRPKKNCDTCPSRSKERHSCHLVTCTRARQAPSSVRFLTGLSCFRLPQRRSEELPPGRIGTSTSIVRDRRSADCYPFARPSFPRKATSSFPIVLIGCLLSHKNPSRPTLPLSRRTETPIAVPVTIGKFRVSLNLDHAP